MPKTINTIPSNQELFEIATAKGTPGAAIFADYDNFEQFAASVAGLDSQTARDKVNEFLNITMAWFDKEMYVEEAVDILEEQGFGTKEAMNYAGMMRNLYVKVSDPVDPKYKGLKNGDNFSPYIVRKAEVTEYFFTTNADYQNYITLQPVEVRTAFANAYGIAELEAKTMQGLRNKFVQWMYEKKLEVLNYLINDQNLKDQQVLEVPMDDFSNEELQNLSNAIDNLTSALTLTVTGAFNMNGWKERQRKEDLRILMRPLIDNAAKNYVTPYAFNDVILKNGIQKVYVENFGGLIPVVEVEGVEVELSPVYDEEGRVTHTYTDESENIYTEDQISWKDPNEDVIAIICDKDIMKVIEQEGYIVESIYNPRTRAVNVWCSEANIGFIYDRQKNCVIVKKKITPEPPTPPIEKVFTSEDITDGATYASTYFITAKTFTITNLEASDTVAMTTELASLVLNENEGTYSVSGVNVGETPQIVKITLNGDIVCTFTVEAPTPAEESKIANFLKNDNK